MTTGDRIRSIRKGRGLTQKALGKLLGVTQATVGQYETNTNPPKLETLYRIAEALDVPVFNLIGEVMLCPWDIALDQKLNAVGYSVGFAEAHEEYFQWINYPDGTLEVSDEDLKTLNDSVDNYIRFKLQELKEANRDCFRLIKTEKPPQKPDET